MKKILLIALLAISAFAANTKIDFIVSLKKYDCVLDTWKENTYEHGVDWQYYAKIACKNTDHKPARIAGLKFLDVAINLKGEYIYTYGLEK
jgi:hypothetical protein